MPDDQLWDLAESGQLDQLELLVQTRRLLVSKKSDALIAGSVRERLLIRPVSAALLQRIVANGRGGPQAFFDVTRFENVFLSLGVVKHNAGVKIGLQLEHHGVLVVFGFGNTSSDLVQLAGLAEKILDMLTHFVRDHVAAVPNQHQVQGFLEFARILGIPVDEPVWNLPIEEEATDWVEKQLPGDSPVLVVNPCSSHPWRNWRPENYAEVADYAAREAGMKIVLAGGPSELEIGTAQKIESHMTQPCLNLVGKDTLERSKALLKRADLVITPDSGPAHIAAALQTPVLGLYAATWSRRSGPYNSLNLCVDRFEEATQKFKGKSADKLRWGTRIKEASVMDLVRPEDVIDRIKSALGAAGDPPAPVG